MRSFTNKNVIDSKNRNLFLIIFGVAFIVLTFIFILLANKQNLSDDNNIVYLNDLIESSDDKTDLKSYLEISWLSPKVAVYDDTTDAYYFAFDGEYYYIVFLKESKANELLDMDLENNPVRIEGISRSIPLDVENIAIEQYNDILDEDQEPIDSSSFYGMFGDVYLDQTSSYSGTASMYNTFAFFTGIFGFFMTLVGVIRLVLFNLSVKKLSGMEIDELESEMNGSDAFYYSRNKLYLTSNYVIMLDGRFKVYRYSDILWMYPFEQRYNGIRTNKAIKILTTDGKTTMLANVSVATKTAKAVYDEIWNTIISKNPGIKLGYTSDNIKYFKGIVKEIKNNKNNGI